MSGKWIAFYVGLYIIILILSTISTGGTVIGASGSQESTQLQYLMNISNAVQHITILGIIPLPFPNPEYFSVLWQTLTLQPVRDLFASSGYVVFYWIVIVPIIIMGVYALVSLFMALVRGNFSWT